MRHNSLFAGMALEDEASAVVALPVVQQADFPPMSSPDCLPLIETAVANVDEADNRLDQTIEIQAAFESLREILSGAIATEGLSEVTGELLAVSTSYLNKQMGVRTRPVVALEAYQSAESDQVRATVAMESIANTVARIWRAIIVAIKKMLIWIKDVFVKLFDANDSVKRDCEALRKNMKIWAQKNEQPARSNSPAPATSFRDDRLFNDIAINGAIPKNMPKAMEEYSHLVHQQLTYQLDLPTGQILDLLLKIENKKAWDAEHFIVNIKDAPDMVAKDGESDQEEYANMRHLCTRTKTFGDATVRMMVPKSGLKGEDAVVALSRVYVVVDDNKVISGNNDPLPVLSMEDCDSVLESIKQVTMHIDAFKAKASAQDGVKHRIMSAVEKLEAIIRQVDYHALAEEFGYPSSPNALSGMLRAVVRYLDSPGVEVVRYAARKNSHLLQYVNRSFQVHAGQNSGASAN